MKETLISKAAERRILTRAGILTRQIVGMLDATREGARTEAARREESTAQALAVRAVWAAVSKGMSAEAIADVKQVVADLYAHGAAMREKASEA